MERWTDNVNGEPYTLRGVRTVRGRVLGDPAIAIWKGAGYLAYIVSTRVSMDGKPIDTHYIGVKKSEPARKALEIEFGLLKAEGQAEQKYELKSAYAQQVNYGKTESRKSISLVLKEVLKEYRFCSLPELNAVLSRYNVVADRGGEDSRTYKRGGLHYKILDQEGKPVGVPIKASAFVDKATLRFLEEKFKTNEPHREPHKQRVKNAIDRYFMGNSKSLPGLVQSLAKEGIHLVLRKGKTGQVYGITYVDHQKKCVFNGSALGKNYSAKAIQERCELPPILSPSDNHKVAQAPTGKQPSTDQQQPVPAEDSSGYDPHSRSLLEQLMSPEYTSSQVPYELSGRKKKKKKGRSL